MILRAPVLTLHATAILATHVAAGALLGALGTVVLIMGARRVGGAGAPTDHRPDAIDRSVRPGEF